MRLQTKSNGNIACFVGFEGVFTGTVKVEVGTPGPAEVQVHRTLRFERTDGSWLCMVQRPEMDGIEEHLMHPPGTGCLLVHDSQVIEFLDHLSELMACTEALGNRDKVLGEPPTAEIA